MAKYGLKVRKDAYSSMKKVRELSNAQRSQQRHSLKDSGLTTTAQTSKELLTPPKADSKHRNTFCIREGASDNVEEEVCNMK